MRLLHELSTNSLWINSHLMFKHHQVIRASIVGLGTDESSLTRAIVTRADIDMKKIKEDYLNVNKESIDDAVSGDTSGNYQDFLMTLLGAKL